MSEKTKNVLKIAGYSLILIFISFFGSMDSKEYYLSLNLPKGAPPPLVFPIVWSVLYALMIVATCLIEVKVKDSLSKKDAISYYFTQLMVNALWPYLFFMFKVPLLAFIWLVLLLVLVILTFIKFYNLYKLSGYMLIPYILWIIYAGYINLFVVILN